MRKEPIELTGQQLNGLAAMVALAVLFYVIIVWIPFWGPSTTPVEPFCKREKETLKIALNIDGQERGVYSLLPGATISDLMFAIGTILSPEFDRGECSSRLLTGDKMYLTTGVSAFPIMGRMSAAQSLALDLPVDINKACFEDLLLVPGIGEKTAAQIIVLRAAKGRLHSLDELKELCGIKEKKFDKLQKYFFTVPLG